MRRHQECKSPGGPDADGTVQAREAGLRQCNAVLGSGAVPLVICVAGSGECSPTENRGPQRAQRTGTKPCYVSQAQTEAEISSGRVSDTKFGPQAGVVFSLPVYEPRNGEIDVKNSPEIYSFSRALNQYKASPQPASTHKAPLEGGPKLAYLWPMLNGTR